MNQIKTHFKTIGLLLVSIVIFSCSQKLSPNQINLSYGKNYPQQMLLDSLNMNIKKVGNAETNKAFIRALQFQKRAKLNANYGVIIPKSMVQIAVNGFDDNGPLSPTSKMNIDKWDFMIVYQGLTITETGDEKLEPSVFFYKGKKNKAGNLIPYGTPVTDVEFPRGGGGGGGGASTVPPPTLPDH